MKRRISGSNRGVRGRLSALLVAALLTVTFAVSPGREAIAGLSGSRGLVYYEGVAQAESAEVSAVAAELDGKVRLGIYVGEGTETVTLLRGAFTARGKTVSGNLTAADGPKRTGKFSGSRSTAAPRAITGTLSLGRSGSGPVALTEVPSNADAVKLFSGAWSGKNPDSLASSVQLSLNPGKSSFALTGSTPRGSRFSLEGRYTYVGAGDILQLALLPEKRTFPAELFPAFVTGVPFPQPLAVSHPSGPRLFLTVGYDPVTGAVARAELTRP